jgi:LEA14-like dessication related protein
VQKRLSSKSTGLLLVIGCVVIAVVAAFFGLGVYMRSNVEVTVEDISISADSGGADSGAVGKVLDKITGAAKAVMGKGDLTARLKVKNDTALSAHITSARYWILMGDKEIGRGNWTATEGAPAAFRSREAITLELPFRLDSRSVLASVVESLGGKDLPFRVEGDITISLPLYNVTVPFKASYIKVELPDENSPSY